MGNFARETVLCVMGRVGIRVRVRVRVMRDTVMVFLMLYLHFCHGRSGWSLVKEFVEVLYVSYVEVTATNGGCGYSEVKK